MAQVVQENTAPVSHSDLAIPMQEMGKNKPTTYETLKEQVVSKFGSDKIKEMKSAKEAIKSLQKKNVTENWRIAGGVVAGIALGALGVASYVGAILLSLIASVVPVAIPFIIILGIAAYIGGVMGGWALGEHIIELAENNKRTNERQIGELKGSIITHKNTLSKVISSLSSDKNTNSGLYKSIIAQIETK